MGLAHEYLIQLNVKSCRLCVLGVLFMLSITRKGCVTMFTTFNFARAVFIIK